MKRKTKNLIKEILYWYPITIIIPIMYIIIVKIEYLPMWALSTKDSK